MERITRNRSWGDIFLNALAGWRYAVSSQRNFTIHFVLSFLVIVLGVWSGIGLIRFIFLIFAIVIGLAVEMANTAFEKTIDLITEEWDPKAKIAKDVSAGMVLVTSLGLAVIGLMILAPPLWQKISFLWG